MKEYRKPYVRKVEFEYEEVATTSLGCDPTQIVDIIIFGGDKNPNACKNNGKTEYKYAQSGI